MQKFIARSKTKMTLDGQPETATNLLHYIFRAYRDTLRAEFFGNLRLLDYISCAMHFSV